MTVADLNFSAALAPMLQLTKMRNDV